MDFTSFAGFVCGIIMIASAIISGGNVDSFVSVPGMMIVCAGTLSATFLTFQFRDVIAALKAAYLVFTHKKQDPNDVLATMIQLCDKSRRQGLLELEKVTTRKRFLKKACMLIADGSSESVIREALRTEIDSLKLRHFVVQDVFRKMGLYAPAFGMLGTLIGLVQMLSKLNDPTLIGPAMAIALLTTFYGSILSTMLFLPIAGKLKGRTILQVINLEIMFEGAISILQNSNAVVVYEKLSSFIPARNRRPLDEMRVE